MCTQKKEKKIKALLDEVHDDKKLCAARHAHNLLEDGTLASEAGGASCKDSLRDQVAKELKEEQERKAAQLKQEKAEKLQKRQADKAEKDAKYGLAALAAADSLLKSTSDEDALHVIKVACKLGQAQVSSSSIYQAKVTKERCSAKIVSSYANAIHALQAS